MSYKDNDMYKAFMAKLDGLKDRLSGQEDHALSKLGMFANDAFEEQELHIIQLETELQEAVELLKNSDMWTRYQTLQVAKGVRLQRLRKRMRKALDESPLNPANMIGEDK